MNVRPTKTIDLKDFGHSGTVTLAAPDYERKYQLDEAIAMNCVQMDLNGKGKTYPRAGWINHMRILAYITKAPFELNVEALIGFTKELDESNFGAGEAFINELKEAIKAIDGELNPFVKLGTQANVSSE